MAGDISISDGGTLTAYGIGDHWTDLAVYTDSVRAIVARPGTFADLFPETTDDHIIAVLADALAEAHLQGVLLGSLSDDDYLVRFPLSSAEGALIVLYAGLRVIRAELLNRVTSAKYVAGPVSAETTYATNVLRDILKALEVQKEAVTLRILAGGLATTAFSMQDSYLANATGWPPNGVPLADWLPYPMYPAWAY